MGRCYSLKKLALYKQNWENIIQKIKSGHTLGFEQAYTDQGISIDKSLWCHIPLDILRIEQELDYLSNFLQNHSGISAAFSLTEETARLTSAAISLLNVHSNIDLLSFDNPHLSKVSSWYKKTYSSKIFNSSTFISPQDSIIILFR